MKAILKRDNGYYIGEIIPTKEVDSDGNAVYYKPQNGTMYSIDCVHGRHVNKTHFLSWQRFANTERIIPISDKIYIFIEKNIAQIIKQHDLLLKTLDALTVELKK